MPFVGGFEPHTINATACIASELSSIARAHPLPPKTLKALQTGRFRVFYLKSTVFIRFSNTYQSKKVLKNAIKYRLIRSDFRSDFLPQNKKPTAQQIEVR